MEISEAKVGMKIVALETSKDGLYMKGDILTIVGIDKGNSPLLKLSNGCSHTYYSDSFRSYTPYIDPPLARVSPRVVTLAKSDIKKGMTVKLLDGSTALIINIDNRLRIMSPDGVYMSLDSYSNTLDCTKEGYRDKDSKGIMEVYNDTGSGPELIWKRTISELKCKIDASRSSIAELKDTMIKDRQVLRELIGKIDGDLTELIDIVSSTKDFPLWEDNVRMLYNDSLDNRQSFNRNFLKLFSKAKLLRKKEKEHEDLLVKKLAITLANG